MDKKILHTADFHLGLLNHSKLLQNGLPSKFVDAKKSLKQILDYVETEVIDIFVFAGDWASVNRPNPMYISEMIEFLHKLQEQDIYMIWISGNHTASVSSTFNAVSPLASAFKNNKKFIFSYSEKEPKSFTVDNINFVLLPHSNELRKSTNEEKIEIIKKTTKYIKDGFFNILVSHFALDKCIYIPDQNVMEPDFIKYDLVKDYLLRFDLCLLGDIHNKQIIDKKIFYSGSVYQNNFSECGVEKGCFLYEISDEGFEYKFLPIKNREYKKLEITFEDLKTIDKNEFNDSILQVTCKIDDISKQIFYRTEIESFFDNVFILEIVFDYTKKTEVFFKEEDTLEKMLRKYIDNMYQDFKDKDKLSEFCKSVLEQEKTKV